MESLWWQPGLIPCRVRKLPLIGVCVCVTGVCIPIRPFRPIHLHPISLGSWTQIRDQTRHPVIPIIPSHSHPSYMALSHKSSSKSTRRHVCRLGVQRNKSHHCSGCPKTSEATFRQPFTCATGASSGGFNDPSTYDNSPPLKATIGELT